jgi:hypothetical protein
LKPTFLAVFAKNRVCRGGEKSKFEAVYETGIYHAAIASSFTFSSIRKPASAFS